MADDSSLNIEINLGSPSTVGTHGSNGSENTVMTRSRCAAADEELRRQQELNRQQPPPLPAPATLPALTNQLGLALIDNTSATQNLNAAMNNANAALAPQPTLDIAHLMPKDGLNALSLSIRNNATGGMVVTDKQKKLATVSKQYKNAKENAWCWYFEIVIKHCSEALATLASTTIQLPDGGEINASIQAIQGEQPVAKKNIINYTMIAYV